jgi:DNA polymerase-1
MVRIVKSSEIDYLPGEMDKLWLYNGLDCCLTHEVFQKVSPDLDELSKKIYELEKALQGPVMEMKLRGVRIDTRKRDKVKKDFVDDLKRHEVDLQILVALGVGVSPFNWRSLKQLKEVLHDTLGIPPVRWGTKISLDREALERLQAYFIAQPIVNSVLTLRDLAIKIGVLETELDSDGRLRTNYNIAGTVTGRFSSNYTDYGTGTNLQNIEKRLREIFVADPGMKFAQLDAEQGESRVVGAIEWNLFRDSSYLDACESGDLHTSVSRMAWPDRKWTGDVKLDRDIAEEPFYRQHSFRHMAKVLGHGTNYNGTPKTMAEHTKIDQRVIAQFQARYFQGFLAHRRWHQTKADELQRNGFLISLFGRRRHFFGRLTEASTIREAIAYDPQSTLGDLLNSGMLQVWRANRVQLLLQIHDAILVQFPEEIENDVVPWLRKAIEVPIQLSGERTLVIPFEVKTGWNWNDWSNSNPDGLKKYSDTDSRKRTEEVA